MTKVTVLGGTGYAGSNIVRELAGRGHQVRSVSRNLPNGTNQIPGVEYVSADLLASEALAEAVGQPEVLIGALAPRGPLDGKLAPLYQSLFKLAETGSIRVGIVGGAGSLQAFEDGPRVMDLETFPAEFRSEANQLAKVLQELQEADQELDWFFVSPAGEFGAYAPGERLGKYRVGGDVLLVDEGGKSAISGADFGLAIADEIEKMAHSRARFTVAN